MPTQTFEYKQFNWFTAHTPAGEVTFGSLGLPIKRGKAPPAFDVLGPGSSIRTFLHQYDVQNDTDEFKAKYVAVYWHTAQGGDTTTLYVYYC